MKSAAFVDMYSLSGRTQNRLKFKNNVFVIIFVGVRMPIKRKTKTTEAHCRSINLLQKPKNYCYIPVYKLV